MVSVLRTSFILTLFKKKLYLTNILLAKSVATEWTLQILLNSESIYWIAIRPLLDPNCLQNWREIKFMRSFSICGNCSTASCLSPKGGTRGLSAMLKFLTSELAVVTECYDFLVSWFSVTGLAGHIGSVRRFPCLIPNSVPVPAGAA